MRVNLARIRTGRSGQPWRLLGATLLSVCGMVCSADAGFVIAPLGRFAGYLWEDGGFEPPLVPGDELHAVGLFRGFPPDTAQAELPWEPETYVYTYWLRGLTAVRDSVVGDRRTVSYAGAGILGIYREVLPGSYDYGSHPPNATSPSTFADGDLVLECSVTGGSVSLDSTTGLTRVFLEWVEFTGGSFLPTLLPQCGACVPQVWNTSSSLPAPPPGYDRGWEGLLVNAFAISVSPTTWGRVKGLYR